MSPPRDNGFRLELLDRMIRIREFEEGVRFLFLEGAMPGTIHQCQGQEATAVGVCAALREDDFITSTFRGHGHAIAKGLGEQELLDELFGATTGCCKGKGGSMHVGNMAKGMVPGIAIVGGGIPLAAGMALAFRMQKTDRIVACFFGDGAVAEGAFHEGVNMAAIWRLPAIFVCENNLYGASTRIDLVMRNARVSDRAAQYGIAGRPWTATTSRQSSTRPAGLRRGAARARARSCLNSSPTARQVIRGATPASTSRTLRRRNGRRGIPLRSLRPACRRKASRTKQRSRTCERGRRNASPRQSEKARAAPLPSADDLETDVFVEAAS